MNVKGLVLVVLVIGLDVSGVLNLTMIKTIIIKTIIIKTIIIMIVTNI